MDIWMQLMQLRMSSSPDEDPGDDPYCDTSSSSSAPEDDTKAPSCTCTVCETCESTENVLDLTPNVNLTFSYFESIAAACVLEKGIDELYMFGRGDISHDSVMPDLKERFSHVCERAEGNNKFDKETIELIEVALPKLVQRKIQDDRYFLKTTLQNAWSDLITGRGFMSLQETVYFIIKLRNNKMKVFDNAKELDLKMKSLKFEQKELRAKSKLKKSSLERQIGLLARKEHDSCVICQHELRLTDKWERARHEQVLHILLRKEEAYSDDKYINKNKIFDDNRINAEVVKFYSEKIDTMQKQVFWWSDTYDHEIEKLDNTILKKTQELEDFFPQLLRITYDFESRKNEMENHINHRDEIIEHKRKTAAATVIQSFWRGILFRHPEFVPKPPKKGKKEKNK